MHLTLVPYIAVAGEIKTKPTQHSVKELRSIGIQPDILLCRVAEHLPENAKKKIALFTNVSADAVISGIDVEVTIALVGKYIDLTESYKSLSESLIHAGIHTLNKVNIHYVDAEDLEGEGIHKVNEIFSNVDGILVAGGFGDRGVEGKISAANYARKNNVPYLGICLGMQVAVIGYAREVVGWNDANSSEFNPGSSKPVVALISEWQRCFLKEDSLARKVYGDDVIVERHRHRYEVNNALRPELEEAGLIISGTSKDDLVEMVEMPEHRWFVACQFHPEFTSNPRFGHPLFSAYINAAKAYKQDR